VAELLGELLFLFSRLDAVGIIDILLVTLVIYSLLRLVRGTQAVVLLRGIMFLFLAIALLTAVLRLRAFSWLLRNTLPALLISIPVIFAPEIRRALERLGRAGTTFSFAAAPNIIARSLSRARDSRDITVPIGMPSERATSS